jgi:hypothetical protein
MKLLTIILSTCLYSSAWANPESIQVEFPCFDSVKLFKNLRENHKEYPFIVGRTADVAESIMSIWVQPNTQTWTIVATVDDVSCIVGNGKDFKIVPAKKIKSL